MGHAASQDSGRLRAAERALDEANARASRHAAALLRAVQMSREEIRHADRIITDLLDCARVRPPLRQLIRVDELIGSNRFHA